MVEGAGRVIRPLLYTLITMYADIEALVLSGELFNGKERSSSPVRTPSPSSEDEGWHDDEYDTKNTPAPPPEPQHESIGMGPGRTGVKGVIRDRNEAQDLEKQRHAQQIHELNHRMEKSSLGGKTYLDEEREKADRGEQNVDELVKRDRRDVFGATRHGPFGHLREVGRAGFVQAVDKDDQAGAWVVVHLYDQSLDRCFTLDDTLSRLARLNPSTKFLRCRAAALGFASTSSSSTTSHTTHRPSRPIREEYDDDDDYDDKDEYEDDEEDDEDVDLDMLPTMLVYRNGQLVHNWVRVDWEAGTSGVEELLEKYHILSQNLNFGSNGGLLGFQNDEDEDDLFFDDEK